MTTQRITRLVAILILLQSCTEEKVTPRTYPRVLTQPVTEITPSGATFNGEIFFSSVEITDYGFVWSDVPGQQLGNTDYISLGSRTGTGSFSARIERSLEEGKKHYIRAYAKSTENTVYGQVQEFVSLGSKAPLVESFEPKTGTWGDTIQIKGKNFSQVNDKNRVLIGEVATKLIFSSDTLLKVVVPEDFVNSTGKFKVVLAGNAAESNDFFGLESALITGFEPDSANYGVPFEITGSLFSKNFTKVYFNDVEIDAISVSDSLNTITLEVPKGLPVGFQDVKVVIGNRTIVADKKFFRATPLIKNITPTTATYGETVSITGKFFSPDLDDNLVKIYANDPRSYYQAQTLESSYITIKAKVPNVYMGYEPKIAIEVDKELSNAFTLHIARPIIESISPSSGLFPGDKVVLTGKNFPAGARFSMNFSGVSVDQYYVEAISNEQIRFPFPSDVKTYVSQFSAYLEGKIGELQVSSPYVFVTRSKGGYGNRGFLNSDEDLFLFNPTEGGPFWVYNMTSDKWAELPALSSSSQFRNFFYFNIGGFVYAGGGGKSSFSPTYSFYKLNATSASWEQIGDLPKSGRALASYSVGNIGYALMEAQDMVTFAKSYELWAFDSTNETWSFLSSLSPETGLASTPFFFSTENELIFTVDSYRSISTIQEPLWRFDLKTLQWTQTETELLHQLQYVPYKGEKYIIGKKLNEETTVTYKYNLTTHTLETSTFPSLAMKYLIQKSAIEDGKDLILFDSNSIWKYNEKY